MAAKSSETRENEAKRARKGKGKERRRGRASMDEFLNGFECLRRVAPEDERAKTGGAANED